MTHIHDIGNFQTWIQYNRIPLASMWLGNDSYNAKIVCKIYVKTIKNLYGNEVT